MFCRAIGSLAVCLSIVGSCPASAGPAEEEVFAAFEALCLQQLDEPAKMADMVAPMGGVAVPPAAAKDLMAQPGRAWIVSHETRLAMMLSDEGACSAYGPDITDNDAALDTFVANTRNRELNREVVGSETEYIYAVTVVSMKGGSDMHALVIIRFSNLSSIPGFFFTSVPENVARAGGMHLPPWP